MPSFPPKALFIVGCTATGKSALAYRIAEQLPCILISADSRQIYRGIPSISGSASLPLAHEEKNNLLAELGISSYVSNEKTELWLQSCLDFEQSWSIRHFYEASQLLLQRASVNQVLPIFVGGAGLYLSVLAKPPATLFVPQNTSLRNELAKKNISELQKLAQRDVQRWKTLTTSDRSNPVRLIRSIEVSSHGPHPTPSPLVKNSLWIGLQTDSNSLQRRITRNVEHRQEKAIKEVKKLLQRRVKNPAVLSATGVSETIAYLQKQCTKTEWRTNWMNTERKYAKRQQTWFQKQPNILWQNADDMTKTNQLVETVKNWYNQPRNANNEA